MSDYIQFRIAHQTAKVSGKEYVKGDLFPFEAGNLAHKRMWQLGVIVEENVTPKPRATKPKTNGS